jgi:hypothetical protein
LLSTRYRAPSKKTGRADGKDEALSYVIENGKIVVMTVFLLGNKQPNPNIVDANGTGVGSTESDIRRRYKLIEKVLAPYFRESEEDRAAKERVKHGITTPEPFSAILDRCGESGSPASDYIPD